MGCGSSKAADAKAPAGGSPAAPAAPAAPAKSAPAKTAGPAAPAAPPKPVAPKAEYKGPTALHIFAEADKDDSGTLTLDELQGTLQKEGMSEVGHCTHVPRMLHAPVCCMNSSPYTPKDGVLMNKCGPHCATLCSRCVITIDAHLSVRVTHVYAHACSGRLCNAVQDLRQES